MAIGSARDIAGRLARFQPSRWFPSETQNADGSVPRVAAMLSGFGAAFAQIWTLLQYARAQTRLSSSTDGWLDLGIADYAGSALPRTKGEADPAYWLRVQPQLLPKANTRPNIQAALESLTGNPVRMIEPWDPRDTAVLDGHCYYDVDTVENPGCYADPGVRYQGFVECTLPIVPGSAAAPPGTLYDGAGFYDATAFFWDTPSPASGGAELVYALVRKLKVFGTIVWVKFASASALA